MKDQILIGNAADILKSLPPKSVNCIVTSPPYFHKRDYCNEAQLGQEETIEEYVSNLLAIFRECHRVLADDGTFWLNLGDSYGTGSGGQNGNSQYGSTLNYTNTADGAFGDTKQSPLKGMYKQLLMIPARVALALQGDGWVLRQQIIWHKKNALPESTDDRPTTDYEVVYLLAKYPRYFYNAEAVKEPAGDWGNRNRQNGKYTTEKVELAASPHKGLGRGDFSEQGRNKRSVWSINTAQFKEAHFAVMPLELAETCIKAGCPKGGLVLDPFGGAGTTAIAAINNFCHYTLIELNPDYAAMAQKRIEQKRLEGVQLEMFSTLVSSNSL